jgi:glucoamylase
VFLRLLALILALGVLVAWAATGAGAAPAPGAPGETAVWTEADKDGYGTATALRSKVWHTLDDGVLTEVYFPDLGTPSVRDLEFVVSDGSTFAERERDATEHAIELVDRRSLTYRQVNTATSGRYRITKTYVTNPRGAALLVDVRFESLTGEPYQLYVLYDPSLSNGGMDDTGRSRGRRLLASDAESASVLRTSPALTRTSNGYLGTSDGWTDLRDDFRMDWTYRTAPDGNVVQTGRTGLTGLPGSRHLTLALGFGRSTKGAQRAAGTALAPGFGRISARYAAGWHRYLASLKRAPRSAAGHRTTYDVSLMTLAAHEDKTFRGGFIASPSMPWVWGTGLENPSGAYHLVWSRDLYQIATALLAAGDRAAARHALTYLFRRQQKPDGCFPQNTEVDGTEHWTNLQLDQVAFPIVLAWQLGRRDRRTYREHIRPAAECILANGPATPQERWENQGGYSPATIAAEIAGLVCAADIARRAGDRSAAARYRRTADEWQRKVEDWTVTTNGPLAPHPYYLRITKDGNPNAGTTYSIGDGGPSAIDQRRVVDTSYLELVRLGVKPADDQTVVQSLAVVDRELGVDTPSGLFWHRFNFDGYGETREGGPWDLSPPDTFRTIGRIWPIFAGERGEYELAAGSSAGAPLDAVANAGNDGYMIPEQVWDENPPSGQPGFPRGEGTFSATPLAWSHAQFVRLAWSIDAGRPVERPSIVACRYAGICR